VCLCVINCIHAGVFRSVRVGYAHTLYLPLFLPCSCAISFFLVFSSLILCSRYIVSGDGGPSVLISCNASYPSHLVHCPRRCINLIELCDVDVCPVFVKRPSLSFLSFLDSPPLACTSAAFFVVIFPASRVRQPQPQFQRSRSRNVSSEYVYSPRYASRIIKLFFSLSSLLAAGGVRGHTPQPPSPSSSLPPFAALCSALPTLHSHCARRGCAERPKHTQKEED
jgi:hypothetical protein